MQYPEMDPRLLVPPIPKPHQRAAYPAQQEALQPAVWRETARPPVQQEFVQPIIVQPVTEPPNVITFFQPVIDGALIGFVIALILAPIIFPVALMMGIISSAMKDHR